MAESRKTRGLNPPKHISATHHHWQFDPASDTVCISVTELAATVACIINVDLLLTRLV